jgi:phenylacetic acid degradation operon negative regulatory protein
VKDGELLIGIMASLGKKEYSALQLLGLTRPFRVSPASLRTSISRLEGRGVLSAKRGEGKTAYSFSPKGKGIVENMAAGFSAPDWSKWDKSFWGALWSLPAGEKNGRYRLTKKLSLYRFAPLFPGCWIRPRNAEEKMDKKLETLFADPRCRLIAFRPLRPFSKEEVAGLWDIAATGAAMREAVEGARKALSLAPGIEPEEAFVERYRIGGQMVAALFRDPLLPMEFLPADWPAVELRKLFKRYDALMMKQSRPFWQSVLGKDDDLKR